MYSCQSQNIKDVEDCDVTLIKETKAFEEFYSSIDTTSLYKEMILNFEDIKSGILLYQINQGNEFGNFVMIDNLDQTCRIRKKGVDKKIYLSKDDKLFFKNHIPNFNDLNYYQSCSGSSEIIITLLIVKNDNNIVSRFFTISNPFFEPKKINDENYKKIKDLFKVVYTYSLK